MTEIYPKLLDEINKRFRISCGHGQVELAKSLVTLGANDFNIGFINACGNNHYEIVKWLITIGENSFNLRVGFRIACRNGHGEMAKWLLLTLNVNNNIDVDEFNSSFWFACYNGHYEMAKWLITLGANAYKPGLHIANCNGHYELSGFILRYYHSKISILEYPTYENEIIYCLSNGVSRSVFNNIVNIELLWEKLDLYNNNVNQYIQPLIHIQDLNKIITSFLMY